MHGHGGGHLRTLAAGVVVAAAIIHSHRWLACRFRRLLGRANRAAHSSAAVTSGFRCLEVKALQEQLHQHGFAVVDGIVGMSQIRMIRDEIRRLDVDGHMRTGRVQHGDKLSTDSEVRSDRIAFLSLTTNEPFVSTSCPEPSVRTRGDSHRRRFGADLGVDDESGSSECGSSNAPVGTFEARGILLSLLQNMEKLRERLNSSTALIDHVNGRLDGCTAMCAIYPGGGSRYVKHRDALPYRAGRKLTVILYLNEDWRKEDGGELRLWPQSVNDGDTSVVTVAPIADRLIFFVSSLEHEVLPSWAHR
eukprot:scaffold83553_cov25-Tisochrysis_lutea.AAC.3